ncbi:cytochrome P450, partial [Alphaproteobacteria bacterium]|nr:cytochrome P450 [Alphaproteobacteria bacterium]
AFGNGPHFCMGTHIARMLIGDLLLPRLFATFPSIQLDPARPVEWRGFGFRGPICLSVLLAP